MAVAKAPSQLATCHVRVEQALFGRPRGRHERKPSIRPAADDVSGVVNHRILDELSLDCLGCSRRMLKSIQLAFSNALPP
jgi:hypothetical protein